MGMKAVGGTRIAKFESPRNRSERVDVHLMAAILLLSALTFYLDGFQ